jgi:hypothetical protein
MKVRKEERLLFIKFLEDKGIKEIFENNFEKYNGYKPDFTSIKDSSYFRKPINFIIDGFELSNTSQGIDFWLNINFEWRRELTILHIERKKTKYKSNSNRYKK